MEVISFVKVDVTDCPFLLTISDVTSGIATSIDTSTFTFVEPVQTVNPTDSNRVSVDSYGSLSWHIADFKDKSAVGVHDFRLSATSNRYVGETEMQTVDFSVEIKPCISVSSNSETVITNLTYTAVDPVMELAIVNVTENFLCHESYFETVPSADELHPAFRIVNDTDIRSIQLSIKTN